MMAKVKQGKYIQSIDITLIEQNNKYNIYSPYNPALVIELKAMQGARWNPDGKHWTIPITERNINALKFLSGWRPDLPPISDHPQSSSRPLFKHQKEAINFILSRHHCMLAYDMGLGKTLIGIEVMERVPSPYTHREPVWWLVAPFGAQKAWERELRKWDAQIYPEVITTYESLEKRMNETLQVPDGVIFDESIKIKNPNAKRSQVANELCRILRNSNKTTYVILFSGAPAPKEPTDWWHQIECIFPGWLKEGDVYKFRARYANLIEQENEYGKFKKIESWKEDEVAKLGRRIRPLVLAKKKDECYDLPDKIFEVISCKPSEETLQAANLLVDEAQSPIQALEVLREISDGFLYTEDEDGNRVTEYLGSPKEEVIKELLDFYSIDNGGPGRLVIYGVFHATIDRLAQICSDNGWEYGTVDGRGWSHPNVLEEFDNSSDNLCIIAHPGSVYGLSLTKTHALVYYSNSFNTDHRIQSLERRDRPGMNNQGTRIIDVCHLDTDKLILDRINKNIGLQGITLKEIKNALGRI